jgi:predicted dehydrogenase
VHRYVPSARFVKQLLDECAIGQVHHCNVTYQQGWLTDPTFPRVWRLEAAVSGTGVLGDLGSHVIDLARWWLGSEIASVAGRLRTFHDRRPAPPTPAATLASLRESRRQTSAAATVPVDVDDAATWLATFASGAEAVFFTSRNATAHANHQRAEIYGSDGAIVFENGVRDSIQASLGPAMWRRNAWATFKVPPALMREDHRNSMHYFAQDVATGSQIGPTFLDGLRAQEVMDAIERSATQRGWVDVEST